MSLVFTEERMEFINRMFFDGKFQVYLYENDDVLHGQFFSLFNTFIFETVRTHYTDVEQKLLTKVREHYINYKNQKE